MSHTSKALRDIAAGEDYKALVSAIENRDYQALFDSYIKVGKALEEAEKQIAEKIESLPRRNKEEERQKMHAAFMQRSGSDVPQWYWVKSEIQKQQVVDGMVVSMGKKGDPLVRTPEGRLVVLTGAQAKEGDKVTLQIVTTGERMDFGRPFQLNADSFYYILNQEIHIKVRDALDAVHKRIDAYPGLTGDARLAELGELLKMLAEVKELAPKLMQNEKEMALNRAAFYRRRLMELTVETLVFDMVSAEEEREIKELYQGDETKLVGALASHGLLRRRAFQEFKESLFKGGELHGYTEMLGEMEKKLDTMSSALEFMDVKEGMDGLQPKAKQYLDRMGRFYSRLQVRASQLSRSLADDNATSAEQVLSKVRESFSEKAIGEELRRVFRSAQDFFDTRNAALELKAKLGDTDSAADEAAIKPYLRKKLVAAFGG